MTDPRKPVFDAARAIGADFNKVGNIAVLHEALDRIGARREERAPPSASQPKWIEVARLLLGQREIPGPRHNSWIAKGWARLGAGWYNNDETPWCGFLIAHCMEAAGLPYPKGGRFASAAAWADYGVACRPQLGAIGVKKRRGGNHVFFIVGETADRRFYKALGGNQGNAVSIIDIAKSDVFALRWPPGVPQANIGLPNMPRGTTGASEA